MLAAVWAFLGGLRAVARAPLLVAGVYLVTLAAAAPFGVAIAYTLGLELQHTEIAPTARQMPIDWWETIAQHATGLSAAFTPTTIGFAAPLDNLSAFVDARHRPDAVMIGVAAYLAIWPFLWGGILNRFAQREARGLGRFLRAGWHHVGPLARVAIVALLAYALLFGVVHPALFAGVYGWLAQAVATDQAVFLWRLALYVVFAALLAIVSVVADYARVFVVVGPRFRVRDALASAIAFLRGHPWPALALFVLSVISFLVVLGGYAAFEVVSRGAPRLWLAIVIGQLYILGRLVVRLLTAASQLVLVTSIE